MPAVWTKQVKLYQHLWKRLGVQFCDGCGKVMRGEHYWKWATVHIGPDNQWISLEANSCTNAGCSGVALLHLLTSHEAVFE